MIKYNNKLTCNSALNSHLYSKIILDNGLKVIFVRDEGSPILNFQIKYKVGSANEGDLYLGFAHLFEHLMFQGSLNVLPNEHLALINKLGGHANAYTERDITTFYEKLPIQYLEKLLWLESDRMGFLLQDLDSEKLVNQIKVIKNEHRQCFNKMHANEFRSLIAANLYNKSHPYFNHFNSISPDPDNMSVYKIKQFFLNFYNPNNAVIALSGDLEEELVFSLVEKYFGSIPKGRSSPVDVPASNSLNGNKNISVSDIHVINPFISFTWSAASLYHKDEVVLDVLSVLMRNSLSLHFNDIFADNFLSLSLKNICYSLAGEFSITVYFKNSDRSLLEAAVVALDDFIASFDVKKYAFFIDSAKSEVEFNLFNNLSESENYLSFLSNYELFCDGSFNIDQFLTRCNDLSIDDLVSVYDKYFNNSSRVSLSVDKAQQRSFSDFLPKQVVALNKIQEPLCLNLNAPEEEFRQKPPEELDIKLNKPAPFVWRQKIGSIGIYGFYSRSSITRLVFNFSGSLDLEDISNAGISYLLAAFLLRSRPEKMQELNSIGSKLDFQVMPHYLLIDVSCLTVNLQETIDLIHDLIVFDPLDHQDLFYSLQSELQFYIESASNDPKNKTTNCFNGLLFGDSRYSAPIYGLKASVASLSLMQLRDFYLQQFCDSRLSIKVCSGLDQDNLVNAFSKFKNLSLNYDLTTPPNNIINSVKQNYPVIYLQDNIDVNQVEIKIGRLSDPFDADGLYFKSVLCNYPFGGCFNSRINLDLREIKGSTYSAHSAFFGDLLFGTFNISTSVDAEDTCPALTYLFSSLKKYQAQGMDAQEINSLKTSFANNRLMGCISDNQKMLFLHDLERFSLPEDFLDIQGNIVSESSLVDLNNIVSRQFDVNDMFVLISGDVKKIKSQLKGFNLVHIDNMTI